MGGTDSTINDVITSELLAARSQELFAKSGRDLAMLGFSIGKWTDEVRHIDPCDCDHDEEQAGDNCLTNSAWCWALLRDEGAHGWSFAFQLAPLQHPDQPPKGNP